jgi:hypothetical protein
MSMRGSDGLTRFGLLALPLAGLLALVGLYSTLQLGSGGILASGDNQAIASGGYFLSVFLGNILALAVLILGVVALYAHLANGGQGVLALGALVSSVFGVALTLSTVGVNAYAVPALSRSFLEGKTESISILDHVFAGPLGTVSTLAFLLYSAGFVLFGLAIWRSGALPGWAGVLVAVHAPLVSRPFTAAGSVVGALLAIVGGGWIAMSALRGPSEQEASLRAAPRVR